MYRELDAYELRETADEHGRRMELRAWRAEIADDLFAAESYVEQIVKGGHVEPCSCAPEDGDYGSGSHFQSCPRYDLAHGAA